MVPNKSNAAAKDEESVQGTDFDVFFCFFRCECVAVPQKVNEADSNATVNVEDELKKKIEISMRG